MTLQLSHFLSNFFEIKKADNHIIKLKSFPKAFSSWHDIKWTENLDFGFTNSQFTKIQQKIKDTKVISDALFNVRMRDRSGASKSFLLGKKFVIRLMKNNELTIQVQQVDLVLLKLMPDEKQNHLLGTCQIFYYLKAAIIQADRIQSSEIREKLKTYKQISFGGFLIFGPFEQSYFQEEEQDLIKFEEFCQALRNLNLNEVQICDYLDILLAVILFGGIKPYAQEKKQIFFGEISPSEEDISDSQSTFDQTGEIITIKLSQLLKLHKKIDEVEEIKDVENKQTSKIHLLCKDKLRGSYNYLYQQLYIWTLKRIDEQNPKMDRILFDITLFEKSTPIYFGNQNAIFSFDDFLQNFSIDYVMTNLCDKNQELKSQVSDIASLFENKQNHNSQQLLQDLSKYNTLNNKNIIKLKHSFGEVSYEFSDLQRLNYYLLNEKIQTVYQESENFILKAFVIVKGDSIQTMIKSIIVNLKTYIVSINPVNNFNSNSSSPRGHQSIIEQKTNNEENPPCEDQQIQNQDPATQPN